MGALVGDPVPLIPTLPLVLPNWQLGMAVDEDCRVEGRVAVGPVREYEAVRGLEGG